MRRTPNVGMMGRVRRLLVPRGRWRSSVLGRRRGLPASRIGSTGGVGLVAPGAARTGSSAQDSGSAVFSRDAAHGLTAATTSRRCRRGCPTSATRSRSPATSVIGPSARSSASSWPTTCPRPAAPSGAAPRAALWPPCSQRPRRDDHAPRRLLHRLQRVGVPAQAAVPRVCRQGLDARPGHRHRHRQQRLRPAGHRGGDGRGHDRPGGDRRLRPRRAGPQGLQRHLQGPLHLLRPRRCPRWCRSAPR